jgi:hypothetical protein
MVNFISLNVLPRAVWHKGDRRDSLAYRNAVEICMQCTITLVYQVNHMCVTLLTYIYSYTQVLTLLFCLFKLNQSLGYSFFLAL